MKRYTLLLVHTVFLCAGLTSHAATIASKPAKTTLAGTEKIPLDDSGTDKHATVSTLWKSPALSGGLTSSGSAANDFSGSTGEFKTSTGVNTFGGSGHAFASKLYPVTNDGAPLGDSTHHFSDLFLATGAVINFNNGNVVITQTTGVLTLGTGNLIITTAGTAAGSVVTTTGTQTLSAKTLTAPKFADLGFIADANGNELVILDTVTSAVNEIKIANAITGTAPTIQASGETNVSLVLAGKGTGDVKLGDGADLTKLLAIELSGATTGKTRIITSSHTDDRTNILPDVAGTFEIAQASTAASLTSDGQAVVPGKATVLQLSSDNATATNRTFTLSATGAVAGQIYVLLGPATNACELADTGIQKLTDVWTPSATDSLTLLFDGTNFIELSRADN